MLRAFIALLTFSLSSACFGQREGLFSLSLEQLLETPIKSTALVEEPFVATSYSVTPSQSSDWGRLGVRNLGELLNHMPATVANIGRGTSRTVAVRGYMDSDPSPGLAVRFDGVPINKIREAGGAMALDGFDLSLLQSTEMIRGPGSALHGNAAFQGVLSLESLAPQGTQGNASVSVGSFDYAAASATGNISNGSNDFMLGVAYRNIGDVNQIYEYSDNDTGEPGVASRRNARENSNLLAKYRYTGDRLTSEATLYLQKFEAKELIGVGASAFGDQGVNDTTDYSDDMQLAKFSGEYRLGEHSHVDGLVFYWQYQDRFHIDATNLAFIESEYKTGREESHRGVQVHHTLDYSNDKFFTYGYEYLLASFDKFYRQEKFAGEAWGEPFAVPGPGYQRELHSLVMDGRNPLNSRGLLLNYGLRWDRYSDFSDQYTPRIGLSQTLPHSQVVHLTYSEGFRAPMLFERFGSGPIAANPSLEPEQLQNIELKYTLTTNTGFHTITLFENRWHDTIQTRALENPSAGKIGAFTNYGQSAARGAEYELTARWRQWQIDVALTYVADKNETTGEDYTRFPRVIGDLMLGYHFSPQWSVNCVNRVMRYDNYTDQLAGDVNPPDYFRSDVSVTWLSAERWEINFVVRNLFDKDNYTQYIDGRTEGLQDERRNFSTQINYAF